MSAGETPSIMPRGASPALARYATRWPVVGRARRVCRFGQDRVGQIRFAVFHEESASPQRESRLRRRVSIAAPVRRSGVNYVFSDFVECYRVYASMFCGNGDRDAKASDLA